MCSTWSHHREQIDCCQTNEWQSRINSCPHKRDHISTWAFRNGHYICWRRHSTSGFAWSAQMLIKITPWNVRCGKKKKKAHSGQRLQYWSVFQAALISLMAFTVCIFPYVFAGTHFRFGVQVNFWIFKKILICCLF